jgi:hypothetical protein
MNLKVWLASLLLAIAPAVAGAVTILPNDNIARGVDSTTAQSFTFTNDVHGKDLKIADFTITFNATQTARLAASTWSVSAPGGTGLPVNFVPEAPTFLTDAVALSNFILGVGESFTIAFVLSQPGVSGSFSFDVKPVPLPAAGWMLVSAIAGVGFLARRRSQMA